MGVFYLQGRGVPRNDIEALSWLQLAADQGSLDAQKAIEELASIENTSQQVDQAERSERANSLVKDLEALADLYSRGVISDVEFNAAKKRLLDLRFRVLTIGRLS